MPEGELGFRFGEPLDVDGDGVADIAAGARFKVGEGISKDGVAAVWSGKNGALLRRWEGQLRGALFGHWTTALPDLDGDGLADVVVAAPQARVEGATHGVVSARSAASGNVIWRRFAPREEMLGWDLAPAGDQDGDGRIDLFVGAPSQQGGRAYLLSGATGEIVRSYAPPRKREFFGWSIASAGDLDGDGRADLLVGGQPEGGDEGGAPSEVYLFSGAGGAEIRRWSDSDLQASFGEMIAGLGDLDGDGRGEIAISSARIGHPEDTEPGKVQVFSGASGALLRQWKGRQPRERFGRMVIGAGDVDGDGTEDIAIGAPRHQAGKAANTGRVELRSGKSDAVLAEWFGDEAEAWFGWHMRRAPDPEGRGRPALLVGSLRRSVGGKPGVGVIDLVVLKKAAAVP
ncbi:MAG: FG-GAP-like repeat-containing protein [Candidatus Binatia bacterium]